MKNNRNDETIRYICHVCSKTECTISSPGHYNVDLPLYKFSSKVDNTFFCEVVSPLLPNHEPSDT